MANIIRSAKSGSDWTSSELYSYNIRVDIRDIQTFFGLPALPPPTVDPELLQIQDANLMANDRNAELINLLDLAMVPGSQESQVDDFAVELFKTLGYVKRHRVACTRKDIPFLICGEWRHAKTDVCIVDRSQNNILLLVQEDKRFGATEATAEAEAQLIAGAVATFSYNNATRVSAGLPKHVSKVRLRGPRCLRQMTTFLERIIPGIVMAGTSPTFYKIPVTTDLEYAVINGLYPENPTQVSKYQPAVPRPSRRWSEGMRPLDARREVIQCYEAFKVVVGI